MSKFEDDVRRIVQDELRKFVMALQKEAEGLDTPYDTAEFESRAYQAVAAAARETGRDYHPDEDCPRRKYAYSGGACTCVPEREGEG